MEQQKEARHAPVIEDEPLRPMFIGILAVQIVVIAALYWAGRFFGSAS